MRQALLISAAFLSLAGAALAQEPGSAPDQPLADARQEARAQALFQDVRCVVCQHESIADSPAGIAGDMRRLVREEIASGSSDAEVRADLVRRWGDYILFKPPVEPGTWLLWFGPVLALIGVGGMLAWRGWKKREDTAVEAPLSPDETRRLEELLASGAVRPDPDASSSHD